MAQQISFLDGESRRCRYCPGTGGEELLKDPCPECEARIEEAEAAYRSACDRYRDVAIGTDFFEPDQRELERIAKANLAAITAARKLDDLRETRG